MLQHSTFFFYRSDSYKPSGERTEEASCISHREKPLEHPAFLIERRTTTSAPASPGQFTPTSAWKDQAGTVLTRMKDEELEWIPRRAYRMGKKRKSMK